MTQYASAPLSELSIALQFGGGLPITPNTAVEIFNRLKDEFPKLEIKSAIGRLGAVSQPTMEVVVDDIRPRYWFSSADEYFLLQVQSDLIAFNWRKRSVPGKISERSYPGFAEMASRHQRFCALVLSIIGAKDVPLPLVVNLYYDNIWLIEENKKVADYLAFWNTIGIPMILGPELKFTAAVDDEQLGSAARIDVISGRGAAEIDGTQMPVSRLVLSAYSYPSALEGVPAALANLHERVTTLFETILTKETREAWR